MMAAAAIAAVAAAAAIAVVAVAFAVFAACRPYVGEAYAWAIVAAAFALTIGLAGMIAAQGARGRSRRRGRYDEEDALGLAERLIDLARDRPVSAVGVALALGIVLIRSPKSLAAIAKAFFETFMGKAEPR
jgi:hypothetical protein